MSSKLLRSELKSIVKECLLEILSEGLSSTVETLSENKSNSRRISKNQYTSKKPASRSSIEQSLSQRNKYLDSIQVGSNQQNIVQNEKFERNIQAAASNLSSDPIMQEIFRDTASTTLQEQIGAENRRSPAITATNGGDAAALAVSQSDPVDLFGGEAASKWAALAFDEWKYI